jgi:hypothetical protein
MPEVSAQSGRAAAEAAEPPGIRVLLAAAPSRFQSTERIALPPVSDLRDSFLAGAKWKHRTAADIATSQRIAEESAFDGTGTQASVTEA